MIATRKDTDFVFGNLINQPMRLVNSFRPATRQFMFERFWFANAAKWIVLRFLYQANERNAFFRSFRTHHDKSSKPAGSNSKLRTGIFK